MSYSWNNRKDYTREQVLSVLLNVERKTGRALPDALRSAFIEELYSLIQGVILDVEEANRKAVEGLGE